MYRYAPQMMHHASGVDKETYLKRVQELDPIIRYCKYNVQRQVRIIVLNANVFIGAMHSSSSSSMTHATVRTYPFARVRAPEGRGSEYTNNVRGRKE